VGNSLLNPVVHINALGQLVSLLTQHRQLTWAMTQRELNDRYAGQVLGTLWAIGHPILLMGLYVFIFGYIFPSRMNLGDEMPRSFVTYILAGIIPWLTFADSMSKGTSVIVGNMNLVKQVVFPLEVLPVKGVLASFVSQLVATGFLLLYMVAVDHQLPLTVLMLPCLFFLQLLAMIGTSYLFSSVGVYFRDLKDVVQVFTTAGLFLAPIIYLPTWVDNIWSPFAVVLYLNPFSHLVWCYQDVFYFGRFEHPASWGIFVILSIVLFYGGYRVFRKLKPMFGQML
jgi:lipopolysaccharide transport system permease protein